MAYSLSREGLNTYTDKNSGEQFIYSQLIFHCWAVFPCFDQPDLKAVLQLSVITRADWVVASNSQETLLPIILD